MREQLLARSGQVLVLTADRDLAGLADRRDIASRAASRGRRQALLQQSTWISSNFAGHLCGGHERDGNRFILND